MTIDEIDENISVEALLEQFPESSAYLTREGVHCFVCGEPAWGTLAELTKSKGIDIDRIMVELKAYLKNINHS